MDDKEKKEKRETPIVDGDARPDMPVNPEDKKDAKHKHTQSGKKKFESERLSDVNSLEDHKDAK